MTYWLFAQRHDDVRFFMSKDSAHVSARAMELAREGWGVQTGHGENVSMECRP